MTTIKTIAKLASVSTATVSRVINSPEQVAAETRLKVQQVIKKLKYIPSANARQLVKPDRTTIGVVLAELSDPFCATIIHEIELYARQFGLKVLVSTSDRDADKERQAIQRLHADGCKAIIVNSVALSNQEIQALSFDIQGLILLNNAVKTLEARCLAFDEEAGAQLAANYLLENNHKQIAILSTHKQQNAAAARLKGLQKSFSAHQLKFDSAHVVYADSNFCGGQHGVEQLLQRGYQFTGLLCFNDAMAIGAMTKLQQLAIRIPEQVSVVGFDDLNLAKHSVPSLTTVTYPIAIMAKKATELAWRLVTGQGEFNQTGFNYRPTLKVRSSTKNKSI